MSVLTQLAQNVVDLVKDAVKVRSVPVDDIHSVIRENVKRHKKVYEMIRLLNTNEYKELYTRYNNIIKQSKIPSADVYATYVKKLQGKARSDEEKFFMNSLSEANDNFVDILNNIDKNLDKFVEGNSIDIKNVRMTSISILGILRQSNILVNFTMYLYAQFTTAITGKLSDIPNYRSKYLMDNVDKVSLIVTQIRNKQGAYMFLEEAKQVRNKNADYVLNATGGGVSFLNLLNSNHYTKGFLDNLETVLSVLNIFRWSQEKWDDYMDECYRANKETLAWMESNVSLLRMELMDTDQNDPKYQHLKKVIDAYDMRIAEYDKKIKDYEAGV